MRFLGQTEIETGVVNQYQNIGCKIFNVLFAELQVV